METTRQVGEKKTKNKYESGNERDKKYDEDAEEKAKKEENLKKEDGGMREQKTRNSMMRSWLMRVITRNTYIIL